MKMRVWAARAGVSSLVLMASASARAQQVDTNPPLPNVLILLDTSGSMERMIDGTLPEASPSNTCNCDATTGVCNWNAQPSPNRFGIVQQSFAGTLTNGYNCAAMPRTSNSVFANEYQIAGVAPYDLDYYLPYHRPIAMDTTASPAVPCVFAPGALPGATTPNGVGPSGTGAGGNATDFPPTAIVNRTYGLTHISSCTFAQNADGTLDTMRDLMRFGLMTFDQDPNPGIGVSSGSNPQVAYPAFTGMWSYFPGWNSNGACPYSGNPVGCSTSTLMAIGARNPAAPPWEGRMVPLPATYDLATQETNTQNIQEVVMASRPYGATPLAGMFTGAQYYFWNDPTGPQQTDPYVQGGCRSQYVVLLTDGAPNLDMRPQCAASSAAGDGGTTSPTGTCPFPLPETTALSLFTTTAQQKVTTYVIGFAVSSYLGDQGQTIYCSSLASNGTLSAICDTAQPSDPDYACCELQKIAVAGGSNQAYFADTPGDLQNALGSILASIAKNTTTRTTPAYSPAVPTVGGDPNQPQTNTSIYLASFNPSPGLPWSGDVVRQRYVCTFANNAYTVPPPNVQNSLGDDFAADLNSGSGPARTFIAFQPDVGTGVPSVDATTTIRPYVATTVGDGIGKYSATTYRGSAAAVIPQITPTAMNLPASCPYVSTQGGAASSLTPTQCRDMLLDFTFAQQSFGDKADFPFVSRFGNALGDIYHATPVVVGPPASLLQDSSYVGFSQKWTPSPPTNQGRKTIVYVATNDGLLHAFWSDVSQLQNNELWAMLPPAAMTGLLSTYPSSHEFLLDGSPVVKDVVWDRGYSNPSDATVWHTTLVAGYGPYEQGYYAVDVTQPDPTNLPSGSNPAAGATVGPTFLWQLTKMPSTNAPLFGSQSATPAVTTLFMDPGDGKGAREIGVAILPGGQNSGPTSSAPTGPSCQRAPKSSDSAPLSGYTTRAAVRCWGGTQTWSDPVIGRSLSIVRLDTGEILRVFMRKSDLTNYTSDTLALAKRITDTPLDSPMTGTPIVYPSDVGSDTSKVFVGDADGTVWRFDLSSSDPTQWIGEVYLDLYNGTVDTSSTSWGDAQPLEVTPVVSLDPAGELVMNIATGTTESYNNSGLEYVYSVTEKVQGSTPKLRAYVNWWLGPPTFQPGERVSGPMTVFNGTLYFSTYAASPPGVQVCTGGMARLWGRDFVTPDNPGDLSQGGLREMQPPAPNPPQTPPPVYIQPSDYDPTLLGKVIPGVSIKATPACASTSAGSDAYVSGTHETVQNLTPGGYSLFTQVGAKSTNGVSGARTFETTVPTPISPTVIDSWAAGID